MILNHMPLPMLVLLACLACLGIVLLLLRIRHRNRVSRAAPVRKTSPAGTLHGKASDDQFTIHRLAIVDQLDAIDHTNRKEMHKLMAFMVESSDWQVLGQQLVLLFDQRVEHLRALVKRHDGVLTAEKALHHTMEVYRLSRLIFALHDELVVKSDIVTEFLDRWLQMNRGMSLAEFNTRVNLDCARVLLLDLDYACPLPQTNLTQLNLAANHCATISKFSHEKSMPCELLLSEITLRKERIIK